MGNWDVELDQNKDRVKTELDAISREAVKELYFKDGYIDFHKICELPPAQPELSEIMDEQAIQHLQSTGWMQNHDREMYESGLREKLADDSGSYDSLIPCEEELDFVQKHKKISCNLIVEPCNDCISRQAAIDAFERFIHELGIEDEPYNYGEMALSAKNVPPVTPKQRTGHWIYTGDYLTDGMLKCSECGEEIDVSKSYYDFCPVCEARMVEPQERSE